MWNDSLVCSLMATYRHQWMRQRCCCTGVIESESGGGVVEYLSDDLPAHLRVPFQLALCERQHTLVVHNDNISGTDAALKLPTWHSSIRHAGHEAGMLVQDVLKSAKGLTTTSARLESTSTTAERERSYPRGQLIRTLTEVVIKRRIDGVRLIPRSASM